MSTVTKKTHDIWRKTTPAAKDVDTFIKDAPEQSQAKLQQLREIILNLVPGAEEVISYKMPVYKLYGKMFIGFAGFKNHIGFYGMSGTFFDVFKKELEGYETAKGTVRFPLDRPLPVKLITKFIHVRVKNL